MEEILQKIFTYTENAKILIGEIEDTNTTDSLKKLHKAYNELFKITEIIEDYKKSEKDGYI